MGKFSNAKRPQKTGVVVDRRFLSVVKKNPFTPVNRIKNHLKTYLCKSQHLQEDFIRMNTVGSPQDVNRW